MAGPSGHGAPVDGVRAREWRCPIRRCTWPAVGGIAAIATLVGSTLRSRCDGQLRRRVRARCDRRATWVRRAVSRRWSPSSGSVRSRSCGADTARARARAVTFRIGAAFPMVASGVAHALPFDGLAVMAALLGAPLTYRLGRSVRALSSEWRERQDACRHPDRVGPRPHPRFCGDVHRALRPNRTRIALREPLLPQIFVLPHGGNSTLVINVDIAETRVALIEERQPRRALSSSASRTAARSATSTSARSRACCPGMQAAFVDIGLDRAAFLHVEDVVPEEDMDELLEREEERRARRGEDDEDAGEERRRPSARRARSRARRRSATCSRRARRSIVQVTQGPDRHQGRARHEPHLAAGSLRRVPADGRSHRHLASASATTRSASACARRSRR